MRKYRMIAVVSSIGLGAGLIVGLAACAPTAPLNVPNGISMCVPYPKANAVGFTLDARNPDTAPITVLSARPGGANLRPGKSWLIPVDDGTNGVGAVPAPYSATSDWVRRAALPAVIKARSNVEIFVSVNFPVNISGAELEGVTFRYRSADGQTHTVASDFDAKFKPHC